MKSAASQIIGASIVCWSFRSGSDQSKYQGAVSLAFVRENPAVTGGFPSQRASDMENGSSWWRHHDDSSVYQILRNAI